MPQSVHPGMAAVAVGPQMATKGKGSMLVDNISLEGVKQVVLSLLMTQKRIWKRMAFIWETCLQGKVWKVGKRTLMVLSMVLPIVVLSCGRLRVAPDNKWDKLSSFHCQSTSPLMKRSIAFTLLVHLTPLWMGAQECADGVIATNCLPLNLWVACNGYTIVGWHPSQLEYHWDTNVWHEWVHKDWVRKP